jgi:hypothetical protein
LTKTEKQEQHLLDPPERRHVADFRSERWPASNRNGRPASIWNAWPASSESALDPSGDEDLPRDFDIQTRCALTINIARHEISPVLLGDALRKLAAMA